MDTESNLSCDLFPSDTTSSSKIEPVQTAHSPVEPSECPEPFTTSSTTASSSITSGFFNADCRLPDFGLRCVPNIRYETAIAKSILQQYSTISGDNLFDHLSDIIKRVIDERPPNIIDFFEEFSRNVREQKLHLPERFPPDKVYDESRMFRVSKRLLQSMKLPWDDDNRDLGLEENVIVEDVKSMSTDLKLDIEGAQQFKIFNDRVQQMQFFWNQCGFSISSEDIFQLASSVSRLQNHPSIVQCRFWGVFNGLKASYYVVEGALTNDEVNNRLDQMEKEMMEKSPEVDNEYENPPKYIPPHVGPELIPGANGWENCPPEELAKMVPKADDIPHVDVTDVFDIPPEAIGKGVNRFSYFVVNSFSDDWIELPIVTPKQIQKSRQIKKFLTGDLEADIQSYPPFPGKEKHYLRALIARITAGTYIAPEGYYRKMTKKEKRAFMGEDVEMEDEEEEEEEELDVEAILSTDNDHVLLKNEKYEKQDFRSLMITENWVHVRPAILNQGRVNWFDEIKAQKEREKQLARLKRLRMLEEMGLEAEEEEEEEEEELGEEEFEADDRREYGPPILSPCNIDTIEETTVPWVARTTSKYTNRNERILVMHSNVWPGSYTFIFDKVCDSIYMGWGHKYVSRNMPFEHLPSVAQEYPHFLDNFLEMTDPTIEEEEAERQRLLEKERRKLQRLNDTDIEDVSEEAEEEEG